MNSKLNVLLALLAAAFLSGCKEPDFIVKSLRWDSKRANAEICNIDERYSGSFSVSFSYYESPTPTHSKLYQIIKPDVSIGEGSCTWCNADFTPLIIEPMIKPYKITVKADSTEKVRESKEDNNTYSRVVR